MHLERRKRHNDFVPLTIRMGAAAPAVLGRQPLPTREPRRNINSVLVDKTLHNSQRRQNSGEVHIMHPPARFGAAFPHFFLDLLQQSSSHACTQSDQGIPSHAPSDLCRRADQL
jgi:hypothetical protein